jgi:hypothetical protein
LIPLPVASPKFENAVVRAADISADIEPVPDVVVEHKAVFVAEHEVVVVEHKVAFVAEHEVVVVEHKVAFVAEHEVAELGFGVFVVAPVPDAAELQASVDILVVFVFSVLASVDAIEVRKPGHPMSFAVPNACHYASSSSCAEVLD